MSVNQQKIIQILKNDDKISITLIADKIGISVRKVKENISKLKEAGYVERTGTTRKGLWLVKSLK